MDRFPSSFIAFQAGSILRMCSSHLLAFSAIVLLLMSGCKSGKTIADTAEPLRNRSAAFLLKKYETNEFRYDWLGMKIDADLTKGEEKQSFKANIRMKRDSIIWISISPALGIEVLRVMLTPDSVKYISRIPDQKHYFLGDFSVLSEVARIDLDFRMLQEILIGNAVGIDKEEGKFRSEIDEDRRQYLLISKYRRKIRKVVGVDDRRLNPEDTIIVNPNDPRFQRTARRTDDDDMIVSRYWLEPQNFRLVRSLFNDLLHQRTVEISYGDFEEVEGQFYPSKCNVFVRDAISQQHMSFRITKISQGKEFEFPFDIPLDFERKQKPK